MQPKQEKNQTNNSTFSFVFLLLQGFKKHPMTLTKATYGPKTIGCHAYKPKNTYGSKKGILRPYDHRVVGLKKCHGYLIKTLWP